MGQFVEDFGQGRAGVAFLGSRNDVWHRLGHEMPEGHDIDAWAKAAGLNFEAVKVPALLDLRADQWKRATDGHAALHGDRTPLARDRCFMVRGDNGAMLGDNCVTDIYQPVQPRELLEWFDKYIQVDERFQLDVAGHFKGGSIIWATARWRSPVEIAGDNHLARVLMSTTFDGSGATINQMTTTRVVCDNTLRAAHSDGRAVVRTRHSTKFNAERVGRELAQLAKSVADFKVIGDAMASVHMSADDVKAFFRDILDIPREAKQDDISTRKLNQYRALSTAFSVTRRERNAKQGDPIDVWTALQAVTRYVDHDRISINGDNGEKQFLSATFGSGDAMKGVAMGLLMPRVRDLIAA